MDDDKNLDELINKFQNSKWVTSLPDEIPILFMEEKDLPTNWEEHPDLAAITKLDYEGTPEEVAANYRDKGNEYFTIGKYQEAIACYTKSIQQKKYQTRIQTLFISLTEQQ